MKTRSIILLVAMLFVVVLACASCNLGHQHTWQDATCTTPKTCTGCGATEGEALGHAEEVLEAKDATCSETGLTEGKKCSDCDEILVQQEIIPVTAHTEEVVAGKAPTCTATGLTEGKKCSVCDTVIVEQEEIPMVAHTEEVVPGRDATCTEVGLTAGKKCSVCGGVLEAQTEIAKAPHTYDAGWDADCNVCGATRTCAHDGEKTVVPGKAPTCTEAGLTDGEKCAICGDATVAQNPVDALGHDMSAATCTAASKCQRDGCSHVDGEALGHDYDEGVITTKPGCETKGVKLISCTREGCGHSYEVDVDPTGHSYVETVVPSTCIEKGYTNHVCSNCGHSYKDNETALAEHTYLGNMTKAPMCEEEGLMTYTCSVEGCGHTYTEAIKATGHNKVSHNGKAATCTEDGYEAYETCENCNYTTFKTINALGHKGGKATCKDLAVCETCGKKYGTVDKENGHHYGEADCDSPATCQLCGATSGSAIGHLDDDKNHVCDRTACDKAMGTCEDKDLDHACDYGCGKSYGTCADADKDHDCDYGCDKVYGTCEDKDLDHACDYGCDKVFGTHADGDDNDHLCDYGCSEPVDGEVCVDNNKNHICDECSGRVGGDCADDKNGQDNDHLCDYCGASVGEACYGGTATCTKKAVCVECGKEYGELLAHNYSIKNATESALKSKADCENAAVYYYSCSCGAVDKAEGAKTFQSGESLGHTEKTVAGKAATCTVAGLTDGVICSVCDKVLVEQTVIPVISHTEEILPAKAATCEENGLNEGKKCSACGATLIAQNVIPALGHNFHTFSVSWSDDLSVCTATSYCENDASHVLTESTTTSTVKIVVSDGNVRFIYDAIFENATFAHQGVNIEGTMTVANNIATVYAPTVAGRVASHDFVKFNLLNAEETQEFTIYYSEVDVWDGTSVSTGLQGSGTVEDPFLIQSAADFAYFAGVLNSVEGAAGVNYKVTTFSGQYFKMTKSIDLAGNPLIAGNHTGWNNYQGFFGTFDGNNCSIRGINAQPTTGTSSALFGCIAKGATLKNLIVYGNASGDTTVGGVVAYLLGTIDNITSYVTVSGKSTIGGIVANQEGSGGAITNCVNYGTVTASSYIVGGIVGSGGNSMINCVNWATITGTDCVGGISGGSKDKGEITGCANYGTITASGKSGGIVGQLIKPVSNCVNYGTVNGTWSLGGIAGYVKEGTASITGCVNYGNVNGTTTGNGGILGLSESAATSTVANCVNYGSVTGSWGIGGICGDINKGSVSGCTNNGTINGIGQVAGICGKSGVAISGCTNNGTINASLCENVENDQICGSNVEKTDCVGNGSVVVAAHNMTHTDANAATCETAGNVAYDTCSVCNKHFDANGKEIANVVIPALGHAWDDGVTADGKITYTCANCGGTRVENAMCQVTVNYLNIDGTVASATETLEFAYGEIVTINAKTIEGYVASHDYVKVHVLENQSVTIYYSPVDVWDGTDAWDGTSNVATSLDALGGAGTESDPYIIDSASDLALIANIVNSLAGGKSSSLIKGKYFKMTKSIDLNNNPLYIGGFSGWGNRQIFDGHFDGNNCSIRGINNDRALFGCIEGSARNLSLYGKVYNNTAAGNEAGLVGYLRGQVHYITNYADVSGYTQVGGVVGNLESKTASTHLTNYGTIRSINAKGTWSATGGIIGCVGYSHSDLVNWGDVYSVGSSAGGIGGYGHSSRAGTITNAYNYGTVYCTYQDKSQMLGAIAGHTYVDCHEYGEIVNSLPTEE